MYNCSVINCSLFLCRSALKGYNAVHGGGIVSFIIWMYLITIKHIYCHCFFYTFCVVMDFFLERVRYKKFIIYKKFMILSIYSIGIKRSFSYKSIY